MTGRVCDSFFAFVCDLLMLLCRVICACLVTEGRTRLGLLTTPRRAETWLVHDGVDELMPWDTCVYMQSDKTVMVFKAVGPGWHLGGASVRPEPRWLALLVQSPRASTSRCRAAQASSR